MGAHWRAISSLGAGLLWIVAWTGLVLMPMPTAPADATIVSESRVLGLTLVDYTTLQFSALVLMGISLVGLQVARRHPRSVLGILGRLLTGSAVVITILGLAEWAQMATDGGLLARLAAWVAPATTYRIGLGALLVGPALYSKHLFCAQGRPVGMRWLVKGSACALLLLFAAIVARVIEPPVAIEWIIGVSIGGWWVILGYALWAECASRHIQGQESIAII